MEKLKLLQGIPLWTGECKDGETLHVWQRLPSRQMLVCTGKKNSWTFGWKYDLEDRYGNEVLNPPKNIQDYLDNNPVAGLSGAVEICNHILLGYAAKNILGEDQKREIAAVQKVLTALTKEPIP